MAVEVYWDFRGQCGDGNQCFSLARWVSVDQMKGKGNCLRLIGGTGSVLSQSSSPDSALCGLGQRGPRVCFDSKSHLELGTEHGARRLCIFPPACLAASCPSLSKLFLFSLSSSFVPS